MHIYKLTDRPSPLTPLAHATCTDSICSDSAFQMPAQPTHRLEASHTNIPGVTQTSGLVRGRWSGYFLWAVFRATPQHPAGLPVQWLSADVALRVTDSQRSMSMSEGQPAPRVSRDGFARLAAAPR